MTAPTLTPVRRPGPVCADNPDGQYPDLNDSAAVRAAKRVCADCPIRAACLRQAIDGGEELGVWGGLTEPERARYAGAPTRQRKRGPHPIPAMRCTQPGCLLWYVPTSTSRRSRCPWCLSHTTRARYRTAASNCSLTPHRPQIEAMAAAGMSDKEIAAELGATKRAVQFARATWGVPSGWVLRQQIQAGVVPAQDQSVPSTTPCAASAV